MQKTHEREISGATQWLSEQRRHISATRDTFQGARALSDSLRSRYRFALVGNFVVATSAVFFALTTARQELRALSMPVYQPTQALSEEGLIVSLFLLAALCLIQTRRLYVQLRDDATGYRALIQLRRMDRQMADQIQQANKIATNLELKLRKGQTIPLHQQRTPEKEMGRLTTLSEKWLAPSTPLSKTLLNLLFLCNVLSWSITACATMMGLHLLFLTYTQTWYTWDESTINLARWALPFALLLLAAMLLFLLRPEDAVFNSARLLIHLPLVPLALSLSWFIVAIPHFTIVALRFLWEEIKAIASIPILSIMS